MTKKKLVDNRNYRSKQQKEKMDKAFKLNICPFCTEGLEKIHGLPIEKETNDFFVTKNAFPYEGTKVHYLIITKKHIDTIEKITPNMWSQIGEMFAWIRSSGEVESGGFFLRFGEMKKTGSSVSHVHFHVISGSKSMQDENCESLKVKFGYK